MSLPYTRFFWSDWRAATGHLDLMERGAYMALLEFIYQHQKPLPGDLQRVYRLTHATSTTEQKAVSDMLREFFFQFEDPEQGIVWRHLRAEREIEWSSKRQGVATDKAKKAADAKWGKGINNENGAPMTRAQRLKVARDKARHTEDEWSAMVTICGSSCLSCGSSGDGDGGIVKDHIQPIYQGGSDGIENLQPLCQRCNARKGPNGEDFRPKDWKRMLERLLKQTSNACLDACLTSAIQNQNQNQNQNQEPYPEPAEKNTHVVLGNEKPQNQIAAVERDAPDLSVLDFDSQTKTPDRAVFEYWRDKMGHPKAKLASKRRRCINARLKEGYTVADICRAIDGCKASDWHQGKNDRKTVFDDIELICRDATKLDAFIAKADDASREQAKMDDFLSGTYKSALYPDPTDNTIEGEFHAI